MHLKKYSSKRNLKTSLEPKPKISKHKGRALKFVIHKHDARHLHYDFRLEVDGVLKSWAIPKGPSLDPKIKRLAIMVEDHPYAYRTFEGVIPSGYGAGTVMIWDQGTYDVDGLSSQLSQKQLKEGLKKGVLHFTLNGDKLKGRYSLIKLKKDEDQWMLIKSKDVYASKENIIEKDRSVVSNKTLEEISGHVSPHALEKGKKKAKPNSLKPMLATLVDAPFDSDEWLFEIKLDGFRALVDITPKKVQIYSRNLKSFNERFAHLVQPLKELGIDAILDGEIVALDKKGRSHFQMLQNAAESNTCFFVFDILYLNGRDLRALPLIERKAILKQIISSHAPVLFLDHVEDNGKAFFQLCKKHGLEGIIGKKKDSAYHANIRSKEWVKIKAELSQEVVICGFTQPKKSRKNFGALIMGVYKNGKLHFAGHVGGGFTEDQLEKIKQQLAPLITKTCPFEEPPETNTKVTWVKPKYLCEVKFKEWTDSGIMRMPIFLGMRTDKPAKAIVKEEKENIKKIVRSSKRPAENAYAFISNTEKVFWEKEKITKGDVLLYYSNVAHYILPYLKDRPESLRRFPNGIAKPSFFQKNITSAPDWIETVQIAHHAKDVNYMIIQDEQSLLYAVNLGCIEIHPWMSRKQSVDKPDFLIFDLDPVAISFDAVVETALVLHELLQSIKVKNYCKTSGGRGLHIAVPLSAQYPYEMVKQWAELVAILVHQKLPEVTSLERSPKKRKNKVYIDCYQNNFGQTLAAPYSLRAKPGAPVSTPLEWPELKKGIDPLDYTLFNILQRLKKKGDVFKPILGKGFDMEKSLKQLQKILK